MLGTDKRVWLYVFQYKFEGEWVAVAVVQSFGIAIGCCVAWHEQLVVARSIAITRLTAMAEEHDYYVVCNDKDLPSQYSELTPREPQEWYTLIRDQEFISNLIVAMYL
jgi:hypothetical protein